MVCGIITPQHAEIVFYALATIFTIFPSTSHKSATSTSTTTGTILFYDAYAVRIIVRIIALSHLLFCGCCCVLCLNAYIRPWVVAVCDCRLYTLLHTSDTSRVAGASRTVQCCVCVCTRFGTAQDGGERGRKGKSARVIFVLTPRRSLYETHLIKPKCVCVCVHGFIELVGCVRTSRVLSFMKIYVHLRF